MEHVQVTEVQPVALVQVLQQPIIPALLVTPVIVNQVQVVLEYVLQVHIHIALLPMQP